MSSRQSSRGYKTWEQHYKQLKRFARKEGHCSVPDGYKPAEIRFSQWVAEQRHSRPYLPAENALALEQLPGWYWVLDGFQLKWDHAYGLMQDYIEREGTARIKRLHKEQGFTLGWWVGNQRHAYFKRTLSAYRVGKLEQLPGWKWSDQEIVWEQALAQVKRYLERHGALPLARDECVEGFRIGGWVERQREAYKRGKLSEQQIAQLEQLSGWHWIAYDVRWSRICDMVERYVERAGTLQIPCSYVEDGARLRIWLNTQRTRYRHGLLSDYRINRLSSIPGWTWSPKGGRIERGDDNWDGRYKRFERYIHETGSTSISVKYLDEDGFGLGLWVFTQRQFYRKGELSDYRIRRLEELPDWNWKAREVTWYGKYALLQRFAIREGTAQVPKGHLERGLDLNEWVKYQREYYHRGTLRADRVTRLEALPGWTWKGTEGQWESAYQLLKKYTALHGTSAVPNRYPFERFGLGTWVYNQRRYQYHRDELSADRIARLEKLPGWSWKKRQPNPQSKMEQLWQSRYKKLKRHVARHGSSLAARSVYIGGETLRTWVHEQRYYYRKNELSEQRIQLLEAIPGWTWDIHQNRWQTTFALLERYVARHQSTRIPMDHVEDGVRLGKWAGNQRTFYRKGKLKADRVAQLERIPGWSWSYVDGRDRTEDGQSHVRDDLEAVSTDELLEAIWRSLWGEGVVQETVALRRCANGLYSANLIGTRSLTKEKGVRELLLSLINTAIEYGYLDRPKQGHLRAVIRDAIDYDNSDWEMCVERSIGDEKKNESTVVREAAKWAKGHLGLEVGRVQNGSLVWEQLDAAISRLLESGTLRQVRGGLVKSK